MTRFLFFIDSLSTWVGKAFAWLILILTLGVSYEVFVRYVLSAPTTWAFDFSYITYGALFLMAGAYTLSRGGHVRADVVYRLWKPRTQASVDLVLYVIFFLPAVAAFIYSGWNYAEMSIRFREVSIFSPAGVPVFPLKTLVPVTGILLLLQGLAEDSCAVRYHHQDTVTSGGEGGCCFVERHWVPHGHEHEGALG